MPYAPEAGDLIWADFDPRVGREQSGRRPALVASPADVCRVTELATVCPITSRVRPFGTSVVLPMGLPVSGEILTSHVRSIDTLARPISYAGAAVSTEILLEVRMKLAALIGSSANCVELGSVQRATLVRPLSVTTGFPLTIEPQPI
jgi:mRNA interferase MazF